MIFKSKITTFVKVTSDGTSEFFFETFIIAFFLFVNLVTNPKESIVISANKYNDMDNRALYGSFPLLPKNDVLVYPTAEMYGSANGPKPDERNLPNDGSADNNTSQNDLIAEEGTTPMEVASGTVRSSNPPSPQGSTAGTARSGSQQVSPVGSSQGEAASNTVRSSNPPSPQGSTNKEVAPVWSDIVSGEDHYNSPDSAENRSVLSDGNIDDYDIDPNDEEYGYDNDAYGDEGVDQEEEQEFSEEEGQGDYAPEDDW